METWTGALRLRGNHTAHIMLHPSVLVIGSRDLCPTVTYFAPFDPGNNMRDDFIFVRKPWIDISNKIYINIPAPLPCEILYGSSELTFQINYYMHSSPTAVLGLKLCAPS